MVSSWTHPSSQPAIVEFEYKNMYNVFTKTLDDQLPTLPLIPSYKTISSHTSFHHNTLHPSLPFTTNKYYKHNQLSSRW